MLNWASRGLRTHGLGSSLQSGANPEDGGAPVPSCFAHPLCVSQLDLHADRQRAGAIHGADTAALLHWEVARLHGARTDIKNLFSHWA